MHTVVCGLLVASGVAPLLAQSMSHGNSAKTAASRQGRPPGCPAASAVARAISPGDVVVEAPEHQDYAAAAPGSGGHTVFYAVAPQVTPGDTGARAGPSPPRITPTRPATVKTHASGDVATSNSTHSVARPTAKRPATRHSRPWTVQVASYETLDEAQAMQAALCSRGYEARIVGAVRPYDVRVGRYPTSQAAMAVARRLTSRQLTVFVAPAE
jgi:cell division protein FtsN